MPNVSEIKYKQAFTMRVDPQFLADLDDLRTASRPVRTRAEMLRELVRRAAKAERKRSG